MNNLDQYTEQLNATFKSITGHLNNIKVKEFKYLIKERYIANYSIEGEFLYLTKNIGDGDIQILFSNLNSKHDVTREINLQRERLELDILIALNNQNKF